MENSFKPQVEQAKADIRSIVNEMKTAEVSIIQSSKNIRESFNGAFKISNPDGLNQLMKDLDTTMGRLNTTLNEQTENTKRLGTQKRKLATLNATEKVDSAALARNAKLQATATSKLVGAYDRLNAKRKIARNNLRNLITSEKASTVQIKKAQREFDKYTAKINRANKATSNFSKNSLGGMVRGFRNLVGAFGIVAGASLFAGLAKDVFKITKQLESLNFTLKAVTTSQEEFGRTQLFLRDITQRYGADIITVTERYTKFLAAAKQSNLSLAKTEQIFESVTKASGVLGLKTDELTGVYLALEQMLSKGKVTTEELRRQLGERLPGAFGIMADAVGVTVQQLDKMLRKGEILSSEALPKFARQLEKAYGIEAVTTIDTLVAAQTRLANSWIALVDSFNNSEGKLTKFFKFFLEGFTGILELMTELNTSDADIFSKFLKGLESTALQEELSRLKIKALQAGVSLEDVANTSMARFRFEAKSTASEVALLQNEIKEAKAELDKIPDKSIFGGGATDEQIKQANRLRSEISEISAELQEVQKSAAIAQGKLSAALQITREDEPTAPKATGKPGKLKSKKGSIGFLEERIALYELERKKLATNTDAYRGYTLAIEQLKETLSGLEGDFEIGTLTGGKVDVDTVGSGGNSEIELFKETQKAKLKAISDFKDKYNNISDEILDYQEDKSKEEAQLLQERVRIYKDAISEVTDTFADIFDIDIDKFEFLFDGLENSISDWAVASKEAIGVVLDASLNKYEIELQEAQRSRDLILENDLSSEKQKRLAREKFDKEERRIKTERAKQERTNNLIKIGVDTAVGVVKALASSPPPANFVLAGIVGALGIAQAAVVASRPLPKFAEGHLAGTHSGKALINDSKRRDYQEVVERGNGNVEIHKGRNKVIGMSRGDKVHKSMDSFLTHHNIERDILNMSIQSQREQLMMADRGDMLSGKIDEMTSEFKAATESMEALGKRPIHNHNHLTIEKEFEY